MAEDRATPCDQCGEVFPGLHDCSKAREARAIFEAAKQANDPLSRDTLSRRALELATAAERHFRPQWEADEQLSGGGSVLGTLQN